MGRIEQVIGDIEDYIENCKPVPLSGNKISVSKEEMIDLLTELRHQIPEEVKQYQKIISNQEAIINDAKLQADKLIDEATRKAERLVDEHEIMQKAYDTANKLIDDANTQAQLIIEKATNESNSIKTASIKYTDDMLKNIQSVVFNTMNESQTSFENFMDVLRRNYDVISQNRQELSGTPQDSVSIDIDINKP